MNRRNAWKVAACLIALVLVSGLLGGLLGRRVARLEFQRRSDPRHWNQTVVHDLERALKPTPEQRAKIQAHIDAAVEELDAVRGETVRRSATIVGRLIEQVDRELTPQQRPAFDRMKPKPSELSSLHLLNVEPRSKKP